MEKAIQVEGGYHEHPPFPLLILNHKGIAIQMQLLRTEFIGLVRATDGLAGLQGRRFFYWKYSPAYSAEDDRHEGRLEGTRRNREILSSDTWTLVAVENGRADLADSTEISGHGSATKRTWRDILDCAAH
ncbi:hypothetical protein Ancab_038590 [Ancistrocladus abbreviatus]